MLAGFSNEGWGPAIDAVFAGERDVFALATGSRFLLGWWVLGSVLLVVLLLWLARRRLFQPLARLEQGMVAVAAGNLDVVLPPERDDEIGRLSALFNAMTAATAERVNTPTRQAEHAAARLGRILAASPDEIFVFAAEGGRLIEVSHGALINLGIPPHEITSRTFASLLPEFTTESLETALAPLREGTQDHVALTTHLRRADGSLYPTELTLQLELTDDPPVFTAVGRDISERVRLQVELDRVFELTTDLMASVRTDGTIIRMNHAWGHLLGVDARELAGRSLFDWLHPDDAPKLADTLRRLLGGQTLRDLHLRLRPRESSVRWVALDGEPPVDGVAHLVGREVTEAKEQEELGVGLRVAIARAAREWTQTVDAIDDPILLVEDSLRLVRLNEAARRIADRRHEELVGRSVSDLGDHPLWTHARRLAADALATGQRASVQLHRRGSDHSWDVQALPLRLGPDGTRAVILVAHDVTRVVSMQEEVQRTEAMAAMGELLAGVAHEVRNPLFSMSATIDAFDARHGSGVGGQHLEILRMQLERLSRLMSDLLDYGRPQALDLGTVRIGDVIEQAIEAVRAQAEQADVHIVMEGADGQPVVADRHRLAQVFVNLISNAVSHAPAGSDVRIGIEPLHREGRPQLEITVLDEGPGFPSDALTHVFAPFYTKRPGGTGLGLAIVRRVVEQHGGQATAENAEAGGAIVRVRLPLGN